MGIKIRSGGIPLRGGGGGGGSISVEDHTGESISSAVRTLSWQTLDQFGFTATVDPDDETRVIIGTAPEFVDPISWSSSQTVDVRVSESDAGEVDTYLTNGWEGTVKKGSTADIQFNSTIGRGFDPESSLNVKTYHNGVLVDDITKVCGANGSQTEGNVTVTVSNYEADGDGVFDYWTAQASSEYTPEDIPNHRRGIFRKYTSYYTLDHGSVSDLSSHGMVLDMVRTYNHKGASTGAGRASQHLRRYTEGKDGYMSGYTYRLGNTYNTSSSSVPYNLNTFIPRYRKRFHRYILNYQYTTVNSDTDKIYFDVTPYGIFNWYTVDSRLLTQDSTGIRIPSALLLTFEVGVTDAYAGSINDQVIVTWIAKGQEYKMLMSNKQPSCLVTLDPDTNTQLTIENASSTRKLWEGFKFSAIFLP